MNRRLLVVCYAVFIGVFLSAFADNQPPSEVVAEDPNLLTQADVMISNQSCGPSTALVTMDFNLPRYHTSTSWQTLDGLSAGEYQIFLQADSDLNGHTMNFASNYSANDIFRRVGLSGSQQFTLNINSGRNLGFISHPNGSSGVAATVYICSVTEPDVTGPEVTGPDITEPDVTEPGIATGLPKRNSNGVLVPAQSSGLQLSTAFVTSGMGYWNNHSDVNGRLSDACVRLHDSYWTTGPDGKAYATWHPPVARENGEQCYFGHEHGDDPSDSPFYNDRAYAVQQEQGLIPMPFGYANEVFAASSGSRHEDHFGHKIFRENFRMAYGNSANNAGVESTGAVCDALLKLHQGTHSSDAFSNHLHESIAHIRCDALPGRPASRAHVTALVPIGRPGWFSNTCTEAYRVPGQTGGTNNSGENNAPASTAPNGQLPVVLARGGVRVVDDASPTELTTSLDGERIIAGAGCVNTWQDANSRKVNNHRFGHAMNDTWVRPLTITNSQGSDARFYLKSYYSVHNPSRVFFITNNGDVVKQSSVDACRNARGVNGLPPLTSGFCQQVLDDPSITEGSITSPYNGTIRNLNFKTLDINNKSGTVTMWTDAFGRETNSNSPAIAIPQYVSEGYNGASAVNVAGTLATPNSNRVCRPNSGPYPNNLSRSDPCYWDGNDDLLFAKEWWRDFSAPNLRIHSPN